MSYVAVGAINRQVSVYSGRFILNTLHAHRRYTSLNRGISDNRYLQFDRDSAGNRHKHGETRPLIEDRQ